VSSATRAITAARFTRTSCRRIFPAVIRLKSTRPADDPDDVVPPALQAAPALDERSGVCAGEAE
jgi:hypothetical protein